jgi:multidrug efflux pump subunit AcrA (membrane-fusion protein)
MKKIIRIVFYSAIVIAGIVFIVRTLTRSSPPAAVAQPPDLGRAPARVYGKIEPAGREVFVSPSVTRKVVRVNVREGDAVKRGQTLLLLQNDVEAAQLQVAQAKVESIRGALAISRDILKRKESLYAKNADTEYAFTQAKLQVELDMSNLALAEKEVDLVKAQLGQLELRSPIDGLIYKFDVRLGESLTTDDTSKIILGSADLWVRLSVEAFWTDRVRMGDRCQVFDSETNVLIGEGEVIAKAPYLGRRNFRTEDDQERFDTKYMDVILKLDEAGIHVPLGLSVVAVLPPPAPAEKK